MIRTHTSKKEGFKAHKAKPLDFIDPRAGSPFNDPQALRTKKLEKELCEAGSYVYCKGCMICAYGKEYVKRMDAASDTNAAQ